jgi:hypothetical protein
MLSNASPLELVLLFLVAVIGIPSIALSLDSLASVVVVALRHRAARKLYSARVNELAGRCWPRSSH